jgi:hypothetical protein
MIALANPSSTSTASGAASGTSNSPAWHGRFMSMLPSIVRQARRRLRTVPKALREEALQDVLAHVAVAYARLVQLGREQLAYATPLAGFAVARYRGGRRRGAGGPAASVAATFGCALHANSISSGDTLLPPR